MSAALTVVICAYTTERLRSLDAAIRSLERQTVRPSQVLLVIDHNDVLLDYARLAWPYVQIVPSTGPPGLSGARNTGAAMAEEPLVAFLDDDAQADERWVEHVIRSFGDDAVHAVGGRAEPVWSTVRPPWFPATFDWVVGCTHQGARRTAGPIRNVIGCTMAFRLDSLLAMGGFNPTVGRTASGLLGAEETELCIRLARRFGPLSVHFDPTISVQHHVSHDREEFGYFLRRCLGEGRSKARVAAAVGRSSALAAEQRHVSRTIPAAVARGVLTREGWRTGGPAQTAAVLCGLVAAMSGYAVEHVRLGRATSGGKPSLPLAGGR